MREARFGENMPRSHARRDGEMNNDQVRLFPTWDPCMGSFHGALAWDRYLHGYSGSAPGTRVLTKAHTCAEKGAHT